MEKFTWVKVYNDIAHKILEYSNEKLADLMYKMLEEAEINKLNSENPNLDYDGIKRIKYEEIDPISFMNRFDMYKNDTRKKLILSFEKINNMDINIPKDFIGIPSTNSFNTCVIMFKNERGKDDVQDVRNLFEFALNADSDFDRSKFVELYNKVVAKKYAAFNISIGLFKIRPDLFLNLDNTNREYIKEKLNIKINSCPNGEEYLDIINKVNEYIENNNLINNFLELSELSWKNKNEQADVKGDSLKNMINKENNNKRYYWLNANPKIWEISSIKVGEIIEYESINPSGNKRRIYKNYEDAQIGDLVIMYESTPTKQIKAIGEVASKLTNEKLAIKKIENLVNSVSLEDLKQLEGFENTEFMRNGQGSLFKLTKKEYDEIYDFIRENNPNINIVNNIEKYGKTQFLNDVICDEESYYEILNLLKNNKNIILTGVPGVGKTYIAKKIAYAIIGEKDESRIEFVQFHQSYGYEDFVEGYRPSENGFVLEKGVFYNFCKMAENDPCREYFFIIDEINRGNLSKIFGELLMLIEKDKRGESVKLTYSKLKFSVPENLYIIGMMNTADRSLAIMDYALRRRFAFYKIKPLYNNSKFIDKMKTYNSFKLMEIINLVRKLNDEIKEDSTLGEEFEIGHSYFIGLDNNISDYNLKLIVKYEILPFLEEYWFDDESKYKAWKEKFEGVFND